MHVCVVLLAVLHIINKYIYLFSPRNCSRLAAHIVRHLRLHPDPPPLDGATKNDLLLSNSTSNSPKYSHGCTACVTNRVGREYVVCSLHAATTTNNIHKNNSENKNKSQLNATIYTHVAHNHFVVHTHTYTPLCCAVYFFVSWRWQRAITKSNV